MKQIESKQGWSRTAWRLPLLLALILFGLGVAGAGETPAEKLDIIRRVISERGEYDLAERQLAAFINEYKTIPAAAEALLLLGYCQDKQRKDQDAAATYGRVVTEYAEAPASVRADAGLGAADAFYRLGRYEEAAQNYTKVLELTEKPDQAEAALLWRAEAKYRHGQKEADAGRDGRAWLADSAEDFTTFINRHPESKNLPSALYGAAFSLFDNGEFEKALVFLNRFVDGFPADRRAEECKFYVGESLYQLRRFDEARHVFTQVLSDYPGGTFSPDARAGAAWADLNLGRKSEAAAGFEEAAKLAGDDRDLALSYMYDAGCAWREAGDSQKAAVPLMEVAKASDHELNGLAWFRLGTLWQERAKEAREREEQSATPAEREKFAETRRKMGEDAIMYFRKALESGKLGNEEVEANSIMGEVLLDARRYDEAAATFAEIAKRWPDSERAPWALYHQAIALREQALQASDPAGREAALTKAAASLKECLEFPYAKVRLQAAWALADYLGELGDQAGAREWLRWLADEGVNWANGWRDASGNGDPALVALAKQHAAEGLFRLGEGYFFATDLPRATTYYQNVLNNYPDTPQAAMSLLRLGEIAEEGGDAAGAAGRYAEALRVGEKQNPAQVRLAMGFSRFRLGLLRLFEGQREPDPAAKRNRIQEALKDLNTVLLDPPEGIGLARLHYYLAEAKYGLGLKKESVADYEKSLALEPAGALSDAAWFSLAWARRDLKEYAGALAAARKIIDDYPASSFRPDAFILAAAVHRESGEPAKALAELEAFLVEYSRHALTPKAELERATAMDEVGRHDESAEAFQKFLSDYPGSPDTPQALYQRSWALWNQIKPKVAEARETEREWKALTGGLEPEELPEGERDRALQARDAMQKAAAAVRSAEDEILASLRELTDRYPDYPVIDAAWLRIGEILYDRGEYQQASAAYRRALTLAETRKSELADKAQYRLAWSIQRQAEEAERQIQTLLDPERQETVRKDMWDKRLAAIEMFETILGKFPNSELLGDVCFRAAELRRRSGQDNVDEAKRSGWYQTAIQRYRQAIEKSDKEASYRRAAEYGLALSLLLDRKNNESREQFQKFLSNFTDGPFTQEAYWGLGQANLELGAYAEAGTAFERALLLDKGTETAAKARYGLGLTAVQAGDREKARIEFLAVDALYPNYPEWAAAALVRAARTALVDGFRDKAIGDLERVLARYPSAQAAEEARNLQAQMSSGG